MRDDDLAGPDGAALASLPADGNGAAPRTFLRAVDESAPEQADRVRFGLTGEDIVAVGGAAISGLCLALLLCTVFGIALGWSPVIGFCWFLVLYALLSSLTETGPAVRDRFWSVILWGGAAIVVGTLVLMIVFVLVRGWPVFKQIFSSSSDQSLWQRLHFFTQDMALAGPLSGLNVGGIVYALVGTLEQIGIALAITIPFGLTTAVFLSEVGGRFARFVRTVTEAMTALPSVVAGLFIWSTIILIFTHSDSGFAAALALTVLMLPITIRSADVVLRLVPGNLREAGLALGAGQWRTVWHVVLPTVRSGLVTAVILATAHGIGETAPVLLTSGVTDVTNFNPFSGNQTSLPLAALEFIEEPSKNEIARGFATAAFLLVLVLVLFGLARAFAGGDPSHISGRRARRMRARSRHTLARIEAIRVHDLALATTDLTGFDTDGAGGAGAPPERQEP